MKCPFCAEEIQDQALVCKHCKRGLTPVPSPQPTNSAVNTNPLTKSIDGKEVLKIIGIVILVLISFNLWFITVPAAIIWWLWKKSKFSRKTNIIVTASLALVFAIISGSIAYAGRTPTITITEPQNNYSVQADKATIKGKVNPAKSKVVVHGVALVHISSDGSFSFDAPLADDDNQITVKAVNNDKEASASLTIHRLWTDQEKAERVQAAAEAEAKRKADAEAQAAAQAQADAQAKAAEAAYEKTPAGKLCTKYPNWTKDDCEEVANKRIWVGMTYDMLVAEWGKPDATNPSDYGHGIQYQYCWYNLHPSCFYDKSGGGIIDSYN